MRLQFFALALVVAIAGVPAFAGDNECDGKCDGKGKGHELCRSRAFCPHCGEACYPTVSKDKETKTCWNVETKTICIPKVRFPWEKDCGKDGKDGCPTPKCGRTKNVNVLMKHEYECSTCKYSWDVDSYKDGDGKSDKAPADDLTHAVPNLHRLPPVELAQPSTAGRIAPTTFEQSNQAAPARRSYAEILTSFFK